MAASPPATGDLPAAPNTLDAVAFGRLLRATRQQRGWTLLQLCERSGVSITTISRAERGQLALGYGNLTALSAALQIDLGQMLRAPRADETPAPGPVLTRANAGVSYRGRRFVYEFLGNAGDKRMTPVLGTVQARKGDGPPEFESHPGEEFVHVLSGTVEVHFENGERFRLARGDSLYYDSRVGHAYVSVGRSLARILAVQTSDGAPLPPASLRGDTGQRQRPGRAIG